MSYIHTQEMDGDLIGKKKKIRNTGLGVLMILKEYNLSISKINGKTPKDSQRATSQAYEIADPMRLSKAVLLQH